MEIVWQIILLLILLEIIKTIKNDRPLAPGTVIFLK